jgi:NAD(P)-dependent dehydrogenase (short-subunit alcohol dehydrogenase family)
MPGGVLAGKAVVVTGAGGGIGRAIAMAAAAEGANVMVNDVGGSVSGEGRSQAPGEETVGLIRAAGGAAELSTDSVAGWESAQKIVQAALDHFGRIDAVVNNAGILRDSIFHKMEPADWDAVVNVHLNGSFYVSRAAAPHFRAQGSGAYVHMTSTSGLIGNFGQANYSAAKLGICALSKSIALDMARFGVRSNCIAPNAWSRMIGSIPVTNEAEKARVERLQRMTPEKNAPLAVFLASECAREVNGQIFVSRNNEIFLISHNRPLRGIHRAEGWTPALIAEHALPAMKSGFLPLERSADVFGWDPI